MGSSPDTRNGGLTPVRRPLLGAMLAIATGLFALQAPAQNVPACADDVVHLRGDFGEARFTIDLAVSPDERNQGLMFVEKMPASQGMLFVYERPQQVAFWMKNTLIPLDMIFADEHGVVQNVHVNAVPGDLTPIPGTGAIKYVLEVNGGMAKMLRIGPGTELRHPAIDDAAWACD